MVDKEEIQRVVSSCNDFAEAEKRSKPPFDVPAVAPVACMLTLV